MIFKVTFFARVFVMRTKQPRTNSVKGDGHARIDSSFKTSSAAQTQSDVLILLHFDDVLQVRRLA